ncbi:TlpA family protein disulfide reductase [Salinibacter altiplanensis]|uniref:TlpA family protein disulfide reductase n=1 Tax=Salinibacter altiplanensis TaxID=1803181 RepID=UPI000C9EFAC6|nr:hypothetical protein [Salinibacter altiplanensis]
MRDAADRFGIEWPQVADEDGGYSSMFLVHGDPTYYLVGPDGTALATGERLREEGFEPILDEYLRE